MTLDKLKQLAIAAKAQGNVVVLDAPELLNVLDRIERLEAALKPGEPGHVGYADPFTYVIQHLNSNPYALTKDECVEMVKKLRATYQQAMPVQEPIYQLRSAAGNWIDQSQESYEYNTRHGHATRIVYTATPPTQTPPPRLSNGRFYTLYIEVANQTLRPQDERIALGFARAIETAVRKQFLGRDE